VKIRPSFSFLALTSALLLTACGGGGGGGGSAIGPPPPGPTPCPSGFTGTPPNCVPIVPNTTNASGHVLDDPSGAPLGGISVKVAPWSAGAPVLPSPQTTTAPDGSFTLSAVPNGHYLLIIGSNSPSDTVRPTIHDNVTLSGGNQTLNAPNIPAVSISPNPPAVELSHNYRLATQNPTLELPCMQRFEADRAARGLPPVVLDEWLLENIRATQQWVHTTPRPATNPANPYGSITTGNDSVVGGSDCNGMIDHSFAPGINMYATNPRTLWFAGSYIPDQVNGFGFAEFPIDPRAFTDPNVPTWL